MPLVRQDHQFYQKQLFAAMRIQRAFRGWLARAAISWAKIQILQRAEEAGVRKAARKERKALAKSSLTLLDLSRVRYCE